MLQSVAKTADKMPVRMNQVAKDVAEEDSIGYRIRKEGRKSTSFRKMIFCITTHRKQERLGRVKSKMTALCLKATRMSLMLTKSEII